MDIVETVLMTDRHYLEACDVIDNELETKSIEELEYIVGIGDEYESAPLHTTYVKDGLEADDYIDNNVDDYVDTVESIMLDDDDIIDLFIDNYRGGYENDD